MRVILKLALVTFSVTFSEFYVLFISDLLIVHMKYFA